MALVPWGHHEIKGKVKGRVGNIEFLTEEQKNNPELIAGCVGGALLKNDYLNVISNAGFKYKILDEDIEISKRQYQGINLESLKVELFK